MKNREAWKPSKYVWKSGRLRASRDEREVGTGSRLLGDLVAAFYADCVPKHATGSLIDLGCGKVPLYDVYRSHVDEVTCVDWNHPQSGTSHLDEICDLGKPLPFSESRFQTVILSDVIEHVPEPTTLWAEISRILSPGGKILLNTPFMHCLHEQPHDYYRFSHHALARYAEQNGLSVVSLDAIGGSPELVADITAKHLQFVPLIGKPLASIVQGAAALFLKTGLGQRVSRRTAEAFPLGYTMVAEKTA